MAEQAAVWTTPLTEPALATLAALVQRVGDQCPSTL
jgi:hypothetical protein